jgi:hypothetical protein
MAGTRSYEEDAAMSSISGGDLKPFEGRRRSRSVNWRTQVSPMTFEVWRSTEAILLQNLKNAPAPSHVAVACAASLQNKTARWHQNIAPV